MPIIIENEEEKIPIIIIDTSENIDKDKFLEKINAYHTGILLLKDKAIISSNLISQNSEIYYSNIISNNIESKEELINMMSGEGIYYTYIIFYFTIFIYLFVVYFSSNFVDAIVLGVLGYLFALIIKLRLRYKATFNICIYALTLPILLNLVYILVNTFTGFTINYFDWMYTSISYIYVAVAILMIKTEIINQKIQLIKLEQIQKEIAENQIEEKDEEKERDKDQEDKNEDKEDGKEEPEGSNA